MGELGGVYRQQAHSASLLLIFLVNGMGMGL